MTLLKKTALIAMGAAGLGMLGCDLFVGGRSRREPVYVEQQPRYVEAEPQYIIVQQAPPPMRVERRPPQPSGSSIWIDGYWNWDSHQYRWEAGRYEAPPQPDVIWIAPRYDSDPHGYRFTPGRWNKQNQGNARPIPGNDRGRGRGNN